MYQYDTLDKEFLADRAAEFREQVVRRLAGEITEDQFKPIRLMNGLYLQLHAYMLRVAIPYGSLNPTQLRVLADIGRTYDKGYGHFTTRQNLQFHWIKLADTPDILDRLAAVRSLAAPVMAILNLRGRNENSGCRLDHWRMASDQTRGSSTSSAVAPE